MRQLAGDLRHQYGISIQRECRTIRLHLSVFQYKPKRDPQLPLCLRIKEIASARVRYGYRRIHVLLRKEGWFMNCKLVYRLYREMGLSLRLKRPKRHKSAAHRQMCLEPTTANENWSIQGH